MRSARAFLCCAFTAMLAALSGGSARAANWLEMNFYMSGPHYEGILPPCDYPEALSKISARFNEKENAFTGA